MKKLVLLSAVVFAVMMTSCWSSPNADNSGSKVESTENASVESASNVSTPITVEEKQASDEVSVSKQEPQEASKEVKDNVEPKEEVKK